MTGCGEQDRGKERLYSLTQLLYKYMHDEKEDVMEANGRGA
jgi:hypothetical protein